MKFNSERELAKLYPDCIKIIQNENEDQYSGAKFVAASFVKIEDKIDIHFVYDIGSDENYLWIWGSRHASKDNFYIDEYFELPKKEALKEVKMYYEELYL
jgi:hypothetical protein